MSLSQLIAKYKAHGFTVTRQGINIVILDPDNNIYRKFTYFGYKS